MNYKDIIAQALRKGFQPYGGNDTQQQVMIDGLEVSPYFELTGQSEQEVGSPQQMGYSISTPLGGTRYRTDVLDMNSNFLRSHEHDAGEDKYGLRDMSKLALAALGANYLPGLFGGGEAAGAAGAGEASGLLSGSLTSGITPGAIAAGEAALPGTIGSLTAGLTPAAIAAAEAGLPGAAGALTAGAGTLAGSSLLKYGLPAAGALLSAAGGPSSSSPSGYVDSGYRPTISRGGFDPAPQARQMAAQPTGLLMAPTTGQTDSGLWRYAGGLLGTPSAPTTPAMTPPTMAPPPMRATPPSTVRPTATLAPTTTTSKVTSPATAPVNTSNSSSAAPQFPSWVFNELAPLEKAALYNSYAQRQTPDAEIRALAGTQQDADWQELRNLASTLPIDLVKPFPTQTNIQTAVRDWQNRGQQAGATQQPVTPVEASVSVGVPYVSPAEKFKAHMYQGGANDAEATRRGLGYAKLMGWSPDQTVSTWNDALGTKFSTDDYQRALQAYGFAPSGLLGD